MRVKIPFVSRQYHFKQIFLFRNEIKRLHRCIAENLRQYEDQELASNRKRLNEIQYMLKDATYYYELAKNK